MAYVKVKEENVNSNEVEDEEHVHEIEEEGFEEYDQNKYNLSELEIKRRENMKKNLALFEEFRINEVCFMICVSHFSTDLLFQGR